MDSNRRTAIIRAIHEVYGRVLALPVPGLDLLLVGWRGNNYLLLLPCGPELTEAERRWLHAWAGHAEVVRDEDDALSAIEAKYRQGPEGAG